MGDIKNADQSGKREKTRPLDVLDNLYPRTGWNVHSRQLVLADFIAEHGLNSEFEAFAEERAAEDESLAETDPAIDG